MGLNVFVANIEVSEHRVQRITMHVSSSHGPQTTDHPTTSANISCKLQHIARTRSSQPFPEYTSVRLALTGESLPRTSCLLCSVFCVERQCGFSANCFNCVRGHLHCNYTATMANGHNGHLPGYEGARAAV